jgi:hypothetical protein
MKSDMASDEESEWAMLAGTLKVTQVVYQQYKKPPVAVSSFLFADIWDDIDGAHIVWELCAEAWDRGWNLSAL